MRVLPRRTKSGKRNWRSERKEKGKYVYEFPRPCVTVDTAIFAYKNEGVYDVLHVLLIKRKFDPYKGKWALPGGFLEENEELEQAARREVKEETGLRIRDVHQIHTFGKVNRDPRARVITVTYATLLKSMKTPKAGDDAAIAKWFPLYKLPKLAFDHKEMVEKASMSSFIYNEARIPVL